MPEVERVLTLQKMIGLDGQRSLLECSRSVALGVLLYVIAIRLLKILLPGSIVSALYIECTLTNDYKHVVGLQCVSPSTSSAYLLPLASPHSGVHRAGATQGDLVRTPA